MRWIILTAMALLAACSEENAAGSAYRDASENMLAARAYLEEVSAQPDATQTESGLVYEVLREAEGPSPTQRDAVRVHYKGTLPDGRAFDSSYDRNTPAEFPLSRVIAGWQEGVALMNVGEMYRFHIPPQLAYGARGRPPLIPPNAALVFEIELLAITSKKGT